MTDSPGAGAVLDRLRRGPREIVGGVGWPAVSRPARWRRCQRRGSALNQFSVIYKSITQEFTPQQFPRFHRSIFIFADDDYYP
jgi:hypothetical protein